MGQRLDPWPAVQGTVSAHIVPDPGRRRREVPRFFRMMRGIGPAYAKKLLHTFGEKRRWKRESARPVKSACVWVS